MSVEHYAFERTNRCKSHPRSDVARTIRLVVIEACEERVGEAVQLWCREKKIIIK
jgi:hypothetical protein